MAEKAGGIMNIGDLVRYGDGNPKDYRIGIVVKVIDHPSYGTRTCSVLWTNGVESNHSASWLIHLEVL